jgi:hypothetical protein
MGFAICRLAKLQHHVDLVDIDGADLQGSGLRAEGFKTKATIKLDSKFLMGSNSQLDLFLRALKAWR